MLNNNLNKTQLIYSPLIKEKVKKLNQSNKSNIITDKGRVTFDEFVKAAEIVLDNRKQQKLMNNNIQKRVDVKPNLTSNRNSIISNTGSSQFSSLSRNTTTGSSLQNLNKSLRSSSVNNCSKSNMDENSIQAALNNQQHHQQLQQQFNRMNQMQTSQNTDSNVKHSTHTTTPTKNQSKSTESSKHVTSLQSKFVNLNNCKNYSIIPIENMITSTVSTGSSASSSSSTPTSASISPSSSSSYSSTNYKHLPSHQQHQPNIHATTLSQAFEAANNFKLKNDPQMSESTSTMTNSLNFSKSLNENSLILNNANSCDLNILLYKEKYLLEQGLGNIEAMKCWYQNQIKENKVKQANIQKLKHQNLFSFDKMLLDLKKLNDLNETFKCFLNQNNNSVNQNQSEMDIIKLTNNAQKENIPLELMDTTHLPDYKDYIEQCDLTKKDNELDKFLKEKQEKIDYLQREKSKLIRKLFDMKSEASSINKNISKLKNTNDLSSADKTNAQVTNQILDSSSKVLPIKIESRYCNELIKNKINNNDSKIFNFIELSAINNYSKENRCTSSNTNYELLDSNQRIKSSNQKVFLNNVKSFH
jgi:hypothetical protein